MWQETNKITFWSFNIWREIKEINRFREYWWLLVQNEEYTNTLSIIENLTILKCYHNNAVETIYLAVKDFLIPETRIFRVCFLFSIVSDVK